MSRRFRVWDIENEEYRNSDDVLLRYDGSAISRYALGALDTDMPVNVIIEQYTGLKDKNGKEIYEGDIVRLYGHFVGAITWRDDCCGFRWYDNSGDGYCGLSKDNEEYYEVIGNIHENPELLDDDEEDEEDDYMPTNAEINELTDMGYGG